MLKIFVSLMSGVVAWNLRAEGLLDDGPIKADLASRITSVPSKPPAPPSAPELCARFLDLALRQPFSRLQNYEGLEGPSRQARSAVQDPDLLALTIQAGLAAANFRSQQLAALPQSSAVDPATQFFDVIYIGAGSAETTSQLTLRKRGIHAKTLTIEADEIIARTFYGTRAFYTNSTDGPSASDERPLPNLGLNLNKIPNGLVQTSNFQNSKYPSAGALGDTIAINRLLLDTEFLFKQSVDSYRPTPAPLVALGFPRLTVKLRSGKVFYAHVVLEGSGLGSERSSASSDEGRAFVEAEWTRYLLGGARPRYFSSVRLFNFITGAEAPYRPFVNQRLIVIGKGNFANVECEFFERGGPPEGYKNDTPEVGRYREIIWIAPGIVQTCEAFSSTSRARYLQSIPAGLQKGRILPIDGTSIDVRRGPDGQPQVLYFDKFGREQVVAGDTVIDAIGFRSERLSDVLGHDVIADLPKTENAVVGREIYSGAYRMGVASGAPVTKEELANNDENRASLYLNLVRVEALTNYVVDRHGSDFGRLPPRPRPVPVAATVSPAPIYREVVLFNPDHFVKRRNYATWFLQTMLESAARELAVPAEANLRLDVLADVASANQLRFVVGDLRIGGQILGAAALERFLAVLNATPAFFSVLSDVVNEAGTTRVRFELQLGVPSALLNVSSEPLARAPDVDISGRSILLGFREPQPLSYQTRPLPPDGPSPSSVERRSGRGEEEEDEDEEDEEDYCYGDDDDL